MKTYLGDDGKPQDNNRPQMDSAGRIAITSDSGHIPPPYQLEETFQVSNENDE